MQASNQGSRAADAAPSCMQQVYNGTYKWQVRVACNAWRACCRRLFQHTAPAKLLETERKLLHRASYVAWYGMHGSLARWAGCLHAWMRCASVG